MTPTFAVLLPVKRLAAAKSRLHLPRGSGLDRALLMRAFVADAAAAARRSRWVSEIALVSDDADLTLPGVRRLPDRGGGDLNAALTTAAAELETADSIAVLCADLPCATTAELDAALGLAARASHSAPRCFVPDAAGCGTVLLTASSAAALRPSFGTDSAAAHRAGAREFGLALPGLRHDVDDYAGLLRAAEIGLGPHTRSVVASLR